VIPHPPLNFNELKTLGENSSLSIFQATDIAGNVPYLLLSPNLEEPSLLTIAFNVYLSL
jgi:hypothetical protein